MNDVKVTERGWAGHFICADRCMFRRNTLIECGDVKIVVSTVGNMNPPTGYTGTENQNIGYNRYYETLVFQAHVSDGYYEADTSKQIEYNGKWSIDRLDWDTDLEANEMHDNAVRYFVDKFENMDHPSVKLLFDDSEEN